MANVPLTLGQLGSGVGEGGTGVGEDRIAVGEWVAVGASVGLAVGVGVDVAELPVAVGLPGCDVGAVAVEVTVGG